MNTKEQFVIDVINRYKSAGSTKKLDPLTIAILIAILTEALKFFSNKCLSNLFQKYYINRALKKASVVVQERYNSVHDFYALYCDDDLTQAIVDTKKHLTVQEVKDILP
jgi:hypothetical protein